MKNALQRLEFPEIFLGIVSPVGVSIKSTIDAISDFYKNNGYDVVEIKVTDYFDQIKRGLDIDLPLEKSPLDVRIKNYISFGNKVRSIFDDNSILAAYTIYRIMKDRDRNFKNKDRISYQKRAYILYQFKRKEEIDLLRSVYGRLFYQISVYSRRVSRIEYLSHRIAHERDTADQSTSKPIADDLVSIDENERSNKFGQRVTKIFHDADFIVNSDLVEKDTVEKQVTRFGELLFSSNAISPTKQEYGMFAAKAAALRTLDLSRQVGAAIFRPSGEIICMGSNEVPKAHGGTYWCDESFDAREYTKDEDSNEVRKRELLAEIRAAMPTIMTFDEFLDQEAVRESQFMDALEYGRIVHAEMSAISDAARLGVSIGGSTLFVTTFPCHMCAKHIVAAGIKSVIFLEPYPKSLASDLHSDAIQVEGAPRGRFESYPHVDFEHFHGVTPRRYRELFERETRKKSGKFQKYIQGKKRPNINLIAPFYTELEREVVKYGLIEYERVRGGALDNSVA